MTETPPTRVTLVLPARNGERYLQEALDSILGQTFPDFELVCIDDASSDATASLLAQVAAGDARIRICTNRARRGLPASLNRGFADARGALHGWASHDNRLHSAVIKTLVRALGDHPGCSVAYAAYREIDADGVVTGHHAARPPGDLLQANILGPAFLARAGVWQALGGYDEALEGVEDYDFWLRARHRFRFCPVRESLLDYNLHPGSMTARHSTTIAAAHDRLLEREIPKEPDRRTRAMAWLALMELRRDPARLRYAARAVAAHPGMALSRSRAVMRWMRAALAARSGQAY
ncbi:glycosyltransferase [Erythrobacteraceae bacterium WH01K]|nr:glycosyltransferase [Erythrobacteraceae bacterium WH01K]